MSAKADALFGRIAIDIGLVSEADLRATLVKQNKLDQHVPLGILLIESGLLTQEGLQKIIETQKDRLRVQHQESQARRADGLFGKLVVALGLATDDQIHECIDIQENLDEGDYKRLGDILVERKVLTPLEVTLVLEHQQNLIFFCPQCDTQYNVIMFNPGVTLTCYQCNSNIRIPKTGAFVHPIRSEEGVS
jgi:hypothetical protein